jgi:TPR repeat protein
MRRTLILMIFSLFFASAAFAETPELPADILSAARAGDAEAQVELGILYEYGYRMKDNKITALAWYMKAAELGNARATTYRDKLMQQLSSTEVDRARDLASTLQVSPPRK